MKYLDIIEAKKSYSEGGNVIDLLRNQNKLGINEDMIIEAAYDLQAGTYTRIVDDQAEYMHRYCAELANIAEGYVSGADSLLDIGTGESTTLSLMITKLANPPKRTLAFDISWSRVYKGVDFAKNYLGEYFQKFTPFVADIAEIPMMSKSVSITTSNHALEPNGARLRPLMAELFRVTRDKLVLFEPCYEINSEEGRRRMDKFGYIKGIDEVVEALGGKILNKIKTRVTANPLNPTVCFVIEPPNGLPSQPTDGAVPNGVPTFSAPGSDYPLQRINNFLFSNDTGLCFPVLKDIPVLKSKHAILASALSGA